MRARETEVGMKMPMHVAAIGKKNSDCPKEMVVEENIALHTTQRQMFLALSFSII